MSRIPKIIEVKSYPKINLALDILKKTDSGYHEIRTVFHRLKEPFDEIAIQIDDDLSVKSDNPKLPPDKTNTVLKAALLLKELAGINHGAKIFIKKKIPLMGGLGGGSSNAAAALKVLAYLWGVQCCELSGAHMRAHAQDCLLRRIASQVGMDCAFFFERGAALGEHFGEKITPLPPLPKNIKIEVIETGVEVSSHDAYSFIDLKKCGKNTDKTSRLLNALQNRDSEKILKNLHNDFEEFIFEKFPQLKSQKNAQASDKNSRVLLCGSGGCLVRISLSRLAALPS